MTKETYVLAQFSNGMVRPCIIRRATSPFLDIGDRIITDRGNAVCVTTEVGRYAVDEDPVDVICKAMDLGRELLPSVTGQIEERMWNDD